MTLLGSNIKNNQPIWIKDWKIKKTPFDRILSSCHI